MARELTVLIERRGKPGMIVSDKGPEFTEESRPNSVVRRGPICEIKDSPDPGLVISQLTHELSFTKMQRLFDQVDVQFQIRQIPFNVTTGSAWPPLVGRRCAQFCHSSRNRTFERKPRIGRQLGGNISKGEA